MAWVLPPLAPNFDAALRDVRARRAESRMAAAERLGHAEDAQREPALGGLAQLARDEHAGVRATALAALGMLGADEHLELIIAGLADPFAEVREFAAMALAQIGGERATRALCDALKHQAPEVRFQAVAAIAELDPDRAVHLLPSTLGDPDAEVRAQAVSALASLGHAHLAGHLAGALQDDAPNVRLEAALALASFDDRRGEAALLDALSRRERLAEVAQALARIGAERAREPLAALSSGIFAPPEQRAVCAAALARLGDPRGVANLRRVLRGLRSDARSYAVELTRDLGADELAEDLARLATRPRGTDLLTLVDALAEYAPRHGAARAALEKLAARGDDIGHAASRALAGERKPSSPLPSGEG